MNRIIYVGTDKLDIKYVSDSNHEWKYGHPLEIIKKDYPKLQILFHPFSWSVKGGNNLQNYRTLLREIFLTTINSIDSEISNFPIEEIRREQKL